MESNSTPKKDLKDLEKLLVALSKNKGSDLHLKADLKPVFRVSTVLHEAGPRVLLAPDVKRLVYEILTEEQIAQFERDHNLDFAHNIDGVGRYRVNIFRDRGNVATAIRRVNMEIPPLEELHLPPILKKIATYKEGLIVVAGPTSSGKSTTLASMLEYINRTRKCHIITIEDPIEYLFKDNQSFINQREIGIDVESFHSALKYIVRQNPDVILVGEMRDSESIEAGLNAAQTGHLVFGTISAVNAPQTLGRMLDFFPMERQDLIRQELVFNLKAVISQRLIPGSKPEAPVVPITEIMLVNPSVQKCIQEKQDKKIQDVIRSSATEEMLDFNRSLLNHINSGLIDQATGIKHSPNPDQLKMYLQGIFLDSESRVIG